MKYFKDKYNTIFGYTEEQIDLIDTSDKTELTQFEIKKYVFKEKTKEEEDLIKQRQISAEALKYLSDTDWYVIRQVETNKPIPQDILDARAEARTQIVKEENANVK